MDTLETGRLLLRPWRMRDLRDLYDYARDPEIGPNAGWKPHSSRRESKKILRTFVGNEEVDAIVLRESGRVIGSIGLHPDRLHHGGMGTCREVGYVLRRDCWGRGLMTEAVRRAERYAFETLKLDLLSVAHFPENLRSRSVIEKCGFRYEKTLPGSYIDYRGVPMDEVCYLLARGEYLARENRSFSVAELTRERAEELCGWRYAGPYAVYNSPPWEEVRALGWAMADENRRKNEFGALLDEAGALCGFFRFFEENGEMVLGLGMRPELCGSGCGRRVMGTALAEFRRRFPGRELSLEVRAFNLRACACCRAAGFEETGRGWKDTPVGGDEFIRMKLPGSSPAGRG